MLGTKAIITLIILLLVFIQVGQSADLFVKEPSEETCSHYAKSKIRNSLKDVACKKPFEKLIKLKSTGPNFLLLPNVAKVKRCDGFCPYGQHVCVSIKSTVMRIPVYMINKSKPNAPLTCLYFYVDQHEACQCECAVPGSNCTQLQ